MKKIAILCIAALGAALMVLGTAASASAYPDLTCNLTVNRQVISPGDTFTATGTASGLDAQGHAIPNSSITWDFTWNGVTAHRVGAVATASFRAPAVTRTRDITLVGHTTSPSGSCERRIVITVVASSVAGPTGNGSSGLPNLGGPALLWLLAGLALLVVGGGAVVVSRRRGTPHSD